MEFFNLSELAPLRSSWNFATVFLYCVEVPSAHAFLVRVSRKPRNFPEPSIPHPQARCPSRSFLSVQVYGLESVPSGDPPEQADGMGPRLFRRFSIFAIKVRFFPFLTLFGFLRRLLVKNKLVFCPTPSFLPVVFLGRRRCCASALLKESSFVNFADFRRLFISR